MALVRGGPVAAHVQACADALQAEIPRANSFGTYAGHQPTQQLAIDIFHRVDDNTLSATISAWLQSHLKEYGIDYIISRRRIYNPEISSAWRPMADRGGPTQNHEDHVHVSFEPRITTQGSFDPQPIGDDMSVEDVRAIDANADARSRDEKLHTEQVRDQIISKINQPIDLDALAEKIVQKIVGRLSA